MLSYKKIGTGYPLVLIHGYLGGQFMWKFQEELKNDYDLIMPSLAGYGESSHMTAPSTIKENANQVFELLDYLNLWADHKRTKFEKIAFEKKVGGFLPSKILIYFDKRIFKLEEF